MKKIYIAGQITGLDNFKDIFDKAEKELTKAGNVCMNPATLNKGFEHGEYMHVCYSMIDICDSLYMLPNWKQSKGAQMEHDYGIMHNKEIFYGGRDWRVV